MMLTGDKEHDCACRVARRREGRQPGVLRVLRVLWACGGALVAGLVFGEPVVVEGQPSLGALRPATGVAKPARVSRRTVGDAGTQVSGVRVPAHDTVSGGVREVYDGDRMSVEPHTLASGGGTYERVIEYEGDQRVSASPRTRTGAVGGATTATTVTRPYGGYAVAAPAPTAPGMAGRTDAAGTTSGTFRTGPGSTSAWTATGAAMSVANWTTPAGMLTPPPVPPSLAHLVRAFQDDLERTGKMSSATAQVVASVAVVEADRQRIPPALVFGVMQQESQFNPLARSSKGALGLMQVMPSAWLTPALVQQYGHDLTNPLTNVRFGVHALRVFAEDHQGDWYRTLQRYSGNARQYASKVMGHIQRNAVALCAGQSLDDCAGRPLYVAFHPREDQAAARRSAQPSSTRGR